MTPASPPTHPGPAPARLPGAIADAIRAQARAESPLEACGLIVGSAPPDSGGVALRYVPCRNAAASAVRYTVHAEDLLRTTIDADDAGETIWGIVHSHVSTGAVPSALDLELAYYPEALYLVCSLVARPGLRAWRIVDGLVNEVPLEAADA
jgi:proteasome lid subunit RPN8/RPN11